MEFIVKEFKNEILASSSQSKTGTIFENWISISFFKRNMQDSIS